MEHGPHAARLSGVPDERSAESQTIALCSPSRHAGDTMPLSMTRESKAEVLVGVSRPRDIYRRPSAGGEDDQVRRCPLQRGLGGGGAARSLVVYFWAKMAGPRMEPMPTFLFLDIDGVLLPFGDNVPALKPGTLFDEGCLRSLSQLLAAPLPQGASAQVVLSSTWRARPELIDNILAEFQRYGSAHPGSPLLALGQSGRFFDTTAVNQFGARQHEIASWLARREASGQAAPAAWVCIDDEELLLGKACSSRRALFEGHVVQTRSEVGLTPELAEAAAALLRDQLSAEPPGRRDRPQTSTAHKRSREASIEALAQALSDFTPPPVELVVGCVRCERDCYVGGRVRGTLRARYACPRAVSVSECDLWVCAVCSLVMRTAPTCREHEVLCLDLQKLDAPTSGARAR